MALTAQGNIGLGTITAAAGDVTLTASGSILNANRQSTPNIAATDATLTATNGGIGASDARIITQTTGILNATAGSDIYLKQLGDLQSQWLTTRNGNIDLWVSQGNANLGTVTAPQTVTLTVNGDVLSVNLIRAYTIKADVTNRGSVATFNQMFVGQTVDVIADNPSILRLIPITPGPIYFGIYVTEGGFNLGPLDPGVLLSNNQASKQYRDWMNRVNFRYRPMRPADTVTDLTSQPTNAGGAK